MNGGGEECHEALMLNTMGCSGSLLGTVRYGYCHLIIDDFIERSQASSLASNVGRQMSPLMAVMPASLSLLSHTGPTALLQIF